MGFQNRHALEGGWRGEGGIANAVDGEADLRLTGRTMCRRRDAQSKVGHVLLVFDGSYFMDDDELYNCLNKLSGRV